MHKTKLAVILPLAILLCAFSCHGQVTVGGANVPVINSGPPQNGQVGVLYTFTASGSGGTLPYTWSTVPSPAITGVGAINASTGVMTGTPTAGGTYNFTLKLVDGTGQQANAPFTVQISNALTITSGAPPDGVAGVAYGPFTFTASGGTVPYTWALASGSFPAGLNLNSSTGVLSGSPVGVGVSTFSVKATDAVGAVALAPGVGQFTVNVTGSAPTCGPPNYPCSNTCIGLAPTTCSAVPVPPAPFVGTTGQNQTAYDTSLNATGTNLITRLTDSVAGAASFTVTKSGGSGDVMSSSDDQLLVVNYPAGQGSFGVMSLNPTTAQVVHPGAITTLLHAGSLSFTHIANNILYTLASTGSANLQIWKTTWSDVTNPASFTQTLFYDALASCAPLSGFVVGSTGTLRISADDNRLFFQVFSSGQNSTGFAVVYDIALNKCTTWNSNDNVVTKFDGTTVAGTAPCVPIGVHAGGIAGNGNYGQISTAAIGACSVHDHIWQFNTANIVICDPGGGRNTCGNHEAQGYNVEVHSPYSIVVPQNQAQFYYENFASGPFPPTAFFNQLPNGHDLHFGLQHVDTLDTYPVIGSTDWTGWTGTAFTAPLEDEIAAFQRNGNIQRFTHNFTSGQTLCATCDFRDQQAIGFPSQTGKFFFFTSDMRLGLGTDSKGNPRQDVFVVRLD